MSTASNLEMFFGRLHPLLVHLPIGLIVLLALLEVLALFRRFRNVNGNAGVILVLTVPAAIFSAACGWFLSRAGGYEPSLLQWHQWTAFGTAGLCLIAGGLYAVRLKRAYRFCLLATLVALVVASHYGGSLTHGSDYLTAYAPAPLRALLGSAPKTAHVAATNNAAELEVFAHVIQPMLQKDCVACHGPEKLKGKLRLDSLEALLKGGSGGPAVIAGKGAESELIRRLKLPLAEEEHMPPEGKPQPTEDDITLLLWWIDAGAPAGKKVAELKSNESIKRILAARFGGSPAPKAVAARPLNEVLPVANDLGDQLHVAISPISPTEPWLQCNAAIAGTAFTDAQLAKLAPLAANLRWLDLGGTGITDAGLAHIASMPNVTRLHLERTAITDAGLACVGKLPNLEYLNLYNTPVTAEGIAHLEGLPKLKQVYLWGTKVTPEAAQSLAAARTDAEQVRRWQQEIDALHAKIREAKFIVDLGVAPTAAPASNAVPLNANCPVSGKPVDLTKTVQHDGKLVAFCCDICKAKFQQDPKPFLAKLGPPMPSTEPPKPAQ